MLVALNAFALHMRSGGWRSYGLALLATAGAMASQESCVVLGVLLPAVQVSLTGSIGSRRSLLRYLPFVLLGAVYLLRAWDPDLWASSPAVGQFELSAEILPKAIRSFGRLFIPRALSDWDDPAWALPLGLGATAVGLALALRDRPARAVLLFGLVAGIAGFLPVLPGPWKLVGNRFAYPSSIGAALLVGAGFDLLARNVQATVRSVAFRRAGRGALLAGFLAWTAIQVLAIHSAERWRYERRCERLRNLVETTRGELLAPGGVEGAALVSPPIWNARDYEAAVLLFLGVPRSRVRLEFVPWTESFLRVFDPGGEPDPDRRAVFVSDPDGGIRRVRSGADLPTRSWEAEALERERRGFGRTLALVHFRPDPSTSPK